MSNTTESTSNSIKFAPMPVSALLANLWPLQQEKTPDTSFTDDSDDSVGKINNKTINNDSKDKANKIATPKNVNGTSVKKFTSEKKLCDNNKENVESNWSTNQTHQKNDFNPFQSSQKVIKTPSVYINSEKKRHNVISEDYNSKTVSSKGSTHKKTPEATKLTGSTHKTKTATPTIKSGIRKFTPGSKHSHKKTPLQAIVQNRDKVRCELFGQNQGKKDLQALPPPVIPASAPVQSAPVPETPVNKKLIPASYVATPSYPQGIVGNNNSKILFKTTSIKDKKYMFIKKLGTGGSSEVYKVLEVGTSCEYAVKCVYLATDQELAQGYINEVRLLRELQNSDRVVRLYDYEYDRANQFLRMVLEVGETDLSSFLRARGSGLPPALVLHYWEEMLHAVHYIHDHGVIHADLKPANFLLVCGRLKLIDFGIASAISSDATSVVRSQAAGTYSYISPEALMGGAGGNSSSAPIKISFRSDVWSLGCILYSMVYGRTPFGHIPNLAKLAAILDPNHRIEYSPVEHLPQSLIASLKWCLTYVARARPTVRELLAVKHLQGSPTARRPLPTTLIDKLRVHCTSDELTLLQQATT